MAQVDDDTWDIGNWGYIGRKPYIAAHSTIVEVEILLNYR